MAKLGTKKRPAVVRVQNASRAEEMMTICNKNNWGVIVGIEPDKQEDISDIEKLITPQEPIKKPTYKVGRNEPCRCGSGKKYKKCCLAKSENTAQPIKDEKPASVIICTLTDELFQPIRLYYHIDNKEELIACLKHLKCVDYNQNINTWAILYEKEAGKLNLNIPAKKVPKKARPLIIAKITLHGQIMHIDLRSIERAVAIVEFIDQKIKRDYVKISYMTIYNALFKVKNKDELNDIRKLDYNEIFDEAILSNCLPNVEVQQNAEIILPGSKKEASEEFPQKESELIKKPLPKIEKISVAHYYEDGIDAIKIPLRIRQIIARKHLYG